MRDYFNMRDYFIFINVLICFFLIKKEKVKPTYENHPKQVLSLLSCSLLLLLHSHSPPSTSHHDRRYGARSRHVYGYKSMGFVQNPKTNLYSFIFLMISYEKSKLFIPKFSKQNLKCSPENFLKGLNHNNIKNSFDHEKLEFSKDFVLKKFVCSHTNIRVSLYFYICLYART